MVRLGDFGISRVLSNTLSVASTCVGTPLYLAPELCEGKAYDGKSDVWSLGAILFELCALQPPFTANTMPALVMRICSDAPPKLSDSFSADTRDLAMRLLCKDPDQRPRVHEILEMAFIKARIEQFLDQETITTEFSHTVIRQPAPGPEKGAEGSASAASSSRPRTGAAGAGSGGAGKARPKTGGGAAPGATKRAPSRGGATTGVAGARTAGGPRRPSPGPPEPPPEETAAQRNQRVKEDQERRDAMREQMKRDRLAYARTRSKGVPTAAEIVEQAVQDQHAADKPVMAPVHAPAGEVDESTRRALEAAHPGTRLLTEAERRISHESLIRRQQEVVARVQSSQLKGEAGRAALNEAQRELLDISRIRNAMSKRYVLLRTEAYAGAAEAMPPGTVVAGVPVEEIGLIDEVDAELEIEDDAEEAEDDPPYEEHGAAGALATTLAATMRVSAAGAGPTGPAGLDRTVRVGAAPTDLRTSLAWDCGCSPSMPTEAGSTMGGDDARRHGSGGIQFEVTLEKGAKPFKPPPRQAAESRRSEPPHEAAAAPNAPDASATLSVPAQLFGVGRPLASKIEKLRAHLEEKLGSREAFERVYDYVSREERSEQQSGEREEILAVRTKGQHKTSPHAFLPRTCVPCHAPCLLRAGKALLRTPDPQKPPRPSFTLIRQFMGDEKDCLPLVHTLLYLEEALDVRQ